ncbi:putative glycosyl transferase, family 1 [Helianthus annuus]|nr:putative glycosyl transferase, family 1 [Helianthus annuus]
MLSFYLVQLGQRVIRLFMSNHFLVSYSATTRVASLYSAVDIYVINSQGIGETFGRVTIEAMAFGIPVLGTDAGGTKEIVEHNVTAMRTCYIETCQFTTAELIKRSKLEKNIDLE